MFNLKEPLSKLGPFIKDVSYLHLKSNGNVTILCPSDDNTFNMAAYSKDDTYDEVSGCFSNLRYLQSILNMTDGNIDYDTMTVNDKVLLKTLMFKPDRTVINFNAVNPFRATVTKPFNYDIDWIDEVVISKEDVEKVTSLIKLHSLNMSHGNVDIMEVVFEENVIFNFGKDSHTSSYETNTGTSAYGSILMHSQRFLNVLNLCKGEDVTLKLSNKAILMCFSGDNYEYEVLLIGMRDRDS